MAKFDLHSVLKGMRRTRYYIGNFIAYYTPTPIYKVILLMGFAFISKAAKSEGMNRVSLYCRVKPNATLDESDSVSVGEYKYPYGKKNKYATYFFDLYRSVRFFNKNLRFSYIFGDVAHSMTSPTIVKTRPITPATDFTNSVLCPLNRVRHLVFVNDRRSWRTKIGKMVFRNYVIGQPHRIKFLSATIDSPLCDVGQVNDNAEHPEYVKPYMPIDEMLAYKFIACIEGNDVATNLKWVMSSNSIAVMPRPKIESWFLESRLLPGVHYIEVSDDYSDLDAKLTYYLDHPEEAEAIIRNANAYARLFSHAIIEHWVENQVLKRYFASTGQMSQTKT